MLTNRYKDDCEYDELIDIKSDIKMITENILENIQARLIAVEGAVEALDIRTKIFVPKRIMSNDKKER